jgi:membrane-bound lytic murein transglycosylase D
VRASPLGPVRERSTREVSRRGLVGLGVPAVVFWLLVSGCMGTSAVDAAPRGPVRLSMPAFEGASLFEARVEPARAPTPSTRFDEILASPVMTDPDFQAAVGRWVEYWQTEAAEAVPVFLGRMGTFEAAIDSALAEENLPPTLRYLPFIESGYNPRATSAARAVGMWQFMESTARGLGMEVTRLEDQRRDPLRSTDAAVRFLADLREGFGSWFLALAAYNGGPNRVRRVMRQYARGTAPSDSLFWALRRRFPRETQEFVPKLVGAMFVASRPGSYGFRPPEASEPFAFDDVAVPDATTLDVVAKAAEVSLDEIERLNPQFVRGMTPPGHASVLRVPSGKGDTFARNYAEIPPEERVTFVEHRVEPGETLSHIAVRYGVLVADLNAANPGIRPRFLRIGTVLTVPVAPSARSRSTGG